MLKINLVCVLWFAIDTSHSNCQNMLFSDRSVICFHCGSWSAEIRDSCKSLHLL